MARSRGSSRSRRIQTRAPASVSSAKPPRGARRSRPRSRDALCEDLTAHGMRVPQLLRVLNDVLEVRQASSRLGGRARRRAPRAASCFMKSKAILRRASDSSQLHFTPAPHAIWRARLRRCCRLRPTRNRCSAAAQLTRPTTRTPSPLVWGASSPAGGCCAGEVAGSLGDLGTFLPDLVALSNHSARTCAGCLRLLLRLLVGLRGRGLRPAHADTADAHRRRRLAH